MPNIMPVEPLQMWNEFEPVFIPDIPELAGNQLAIQIIVKIANSIIGNASLNDARMCLYNTCVSNIWRNDYFIKLVTKIVRMIIISTNNGLSFDIALAEAVDVILKCATARIALNDNLYQDGQYNALVALDQKLASIDSQLGMLVTPTANPNLPKNMDAPFVKINEWDFPKKENPNTFGSGYNRFKDMMNLKDRTQFTNDINETNGVKEVHSKIYPDTEVTDSLINTVRDFYMENIDYTKPTGEFLVKSIMHYSPVAKIENTEIFQEVHNLLRLRDTNNINMDLLIEHVERAKDYCKRNHISTAINEADIRVTKFVNKLLKYYTRNIVILDSFVNEFKELQKLDLGNQDLKANIENLMKLGFHYLDTLFKPQVEYNDLDPNIQVSLIENMKVILIPYTYMEFKKLISKDQYTYMGISDQRNNKLSFINVLNGQAGLDLRNIVVTSDMRMYDLTKFYRSDVFLITNY